MRRSVAGGLCVAPLIVLSIAAAIAIAANDGVRFADAAASTLFARSRAAVQGRRAIGGLRSLRLIGRVRVPGDGARTIDGDVEIRIQLPDRFLRVDRIASGATRRQAFGRAEASRLLLGALTMAVDGEPPVVRSTREEPFPDTQMLDVDARSWSGRFVVDASSSIPLRIVYWGGNRGTTITSFADRRDVDGFQFPHRVTTTTAERVLETLIFDEVQLNPRFSAADFKPPL